MKSKISLCNGAILKKDLTRFAPLTLMECVFLLIMGFAYRVGTADYDWESSVDYIEPYVLFSIPALVMGVVSAMVLFTYLTKKKECDAMHALPVTRETLLLTHTIAGFVQVVVPFGVLYLLLPNKEGWLCQMGASMSSWLLAFSAMTLCMMLAGSRLGAAVLFWLANALPSMIYSAVRVMYMPLLPGVYLEQIDNMELYPLALLGKLVERTGLLENTAPMERLWLKILIYTLIGVVLLAVSLVLYRRRKLERAGDHLVVRWLEPVFVWIVGIAAACGGVSFASMLEADTWLFMMIGLTAGYFGARMLLAKSVKVFTKKCLLSFAALAVLLVGSQGVVSMDPLGIVEYVPAAEEIESVTLKKDHDYTGVQSHYTAADADEVERMRMVHQMLVDAGAVSVDNAGYSYRTYRRYHFVYELKDGSAVHRAYLIDEEAIQIHIEYFMSQPECLLDTDSIEDLLKRASDLRVSGNEIMDEAIHVRREFFEVFLSDCEKGNMYTIDSAKYSDWYISFLMDTEDGGWHFISIDIPEAAEDTIAWLEEYFR